MPHPRALLVLTLLLAGCPSGPPDAHCRDKALDSDETDVDCGGSCSSCGVAKRCLTAHDCFTSVCSGGLCAIPSCKDGVLNADESDIDCGGSCPLCPVGKKCTSPIDCLSNTCTAALCEPPLCADDKIDGEETDSDCGGPTCAKCDRGKSCKLPRDCNSAQCTAGKCSSACPPGSEDCDGNAMNGCETRVDFDRQNCGGCNVVCPKTNPYCVGGGCSYHMQALAGSFHVGDGPPAASHPTPQSCTETCAQIFGSVASDYACSTTNDGIDKRAFADGPSDPSHCTTDPVSDTFKLGPSYDCSTKGCAYSTYVADHAECAQATNWCYR